MNRKNRLTFLVLTMVVFSLKGVDASSSKMSCDDIRVKLRAGGTVMVPEGTYICKEPLVLDKDGSSLIGAGPGKTIFKLADHANAPVVVIGDVDQPRPVKNISVKGFTADGNMANQEVECWNSEKCEGSERNQIRNNGITIRGASDITVEDVNLINNRSGGLVTERICRRLNVKNMEASGNYFDGFAGYLTEDSEFTNLKLHHHEHGSGISLDLNFNNNTFRNVDMYDNKDNGIFMRESNGNKFYDITIRNNGNYGVFVTDSYVEHSCPQGNEFKNMKIHGSKRGKGLFVKGKHCKGDGFKQNILSDTEFMDNEIGDLDYDPLALVIKENVTTIAKDKSVDCIAPTLTEDVGAENIQKFYDEKVGPVLK